MLKVLIVKTSSMGDIIHTLPALTDAKAQIKDITFDWVVEPAFAEIPSWHNAVNSIIPCALRKWRKAPITCFQESRHFFKTLRQTRYDLVIDAQGLLKSAFIAKLAKGKRVGFSRESVRESAAAYFYDKTYTVPKGLHAVEKIRQLFAKIFDYAIPLSAPDYGLICEDPLSYGENTVIFLHGTTWTTKHWPKIYWQKLAHLAGSNGYQVLLPWGSLQEKERAQSIVNFCLENKSAHLPQILPKLSLRQITSLITKAKGIVAVDTGLGHIAAAKARPTVSLFGPTDPSLTGAYGPSQTHLKSSLSCSPCLGRECAKGQNFAINPPCFTELSPEVVWQTLTEKME